MAGANNLDAAGFTEIIKGNLELRATLADQAKTLAAANEGIQECAAWLGELVDVVKSGALASAAADPSQPFDVAKYLAEGAAKAGSVEALIDGALRAFPDMASRFKQQE